MSESSSERWNRLTLKLLADCTTIPGKSAYLIPLGIFYIMPSLLGLALFFMPETPRWLLEHNQPVKARHSLVRLRHRDTSPAVIDAELEEMRQSLEHERESTKNIAILDLFQGTNLRRTLLSFGLLTCLAATGSLFFLNYGTYFFAMAGQTKAFQEVVGVTAGGLFATLISIYLITRIGRRRIILGGVAVQAICMLVIAAVYQTHPMTTSTGATLVAFVCIFLFAYNMCCAPYLYLCAGEIPSQHLRGYTLGIAIGIAFFGNWLVSFTAPYFINTYDLNWVRLLALSIFSFSSSLGWACLLLTIFPVGPQIRLHLVRLQHPRLHLDLLLRPRNKGPHARRDRRDVRGAAAGPQVQGLRLCEEHGCETGRLAPSGRCRRWGAQGPGCVACRICLTGFSAGLRKDGDPWGAGLRGGRSRRIDYVSSDLNSKGSVYETGSMEEASISIAADSLSC